MSATYKLKVSGGDSFAKVVKILRTFDPSLSISEIKRRMEEGEYVVEYDLWHWDISEDMKGVNRKQVLKKLIRSLRQCNAEVTVYDEYDEELTDEFFENSLARLKEIEQEVERDIYRETRYEDGDPSDWVIAESEHYIIRGCNEEANLYFKEDGRYITCVGDFYGDPMDGMIDEKERFCVTVGGGYVIYYLREPFESFMYNQTTNQWIEEARDSEHGPWIERVRQISDNEVELTDAEGNIETVCVPL